MFRGTPTLWHVAIKYGINNRTTKIQIKPIYRYGREEKQGKRI